METLIATANLNGVDHSLGSPTSCAAFRSSSLPAARAAPLALEAPAKPQSLSPDDHPMMALAGCLPSARMDDFLTFRPQNGQWLGFRWFPSL
jgi:hypothetical protein